jgi:lipoprotein-releasing system permease protein
MPKLENLFASRFLKARKSNKLLSFLSISSVVGIMLGVTTLITVVSVMDGFTGNLKKKFLGTNPHIILSLADGSGIWDWAGLIKTSEAYPHVDTATPFILSQAMLANDRKVSGVIVKGLDVEAEKRWGGIPETVTDGSFDALEENSDLPAILLGKEIVFTMGVSVGSEVTLISPSNTRGAFGIVPKMTKFKVAGFFDTGMYEHNRSLVYISLKDAQAFYKLGSEVNGIGIIVDDADSAPEIAERMQADLNSIPDGRRYWVRDWLTMNGNLFAALKLEEYALFIILTLITIVASFNIVSMITVTVKDKRRDIAILRAMGAEAKLIEKIFVRQGMFIGLLGTLLGNLLALLIAVALQNFKIITVPKEIYYSDTIPILLSPEVFAIVTLCALSISYFASKIPARICAKIDPLEAIRND